MNVQTIKAKLDPHVLKQSIKWTVYCLLLVNFAFYIIEDWRTATHTLVLAAPIIEWMGVYAQSIDFAAWLVLILLFELETYVLSDEQFTPTVNWLTHGIRLLCYIFVVHTIYAYSVNVYNLYFKVENVPAVSSLCQIADGQVSFVSNQKYIDLNADNCARLGTGKDYFLLYKGMVATDRINLKREKTLAWIDLIEACSWLFIMMLIELNIRLQDRGLSSGPVIITGNYLKLVFYTIILGLAIHWGLTDHFLYFWDELLWIGGFAAIEMNVVDWRDELREETAEKSN